VAFKIWDLNIGIDLDTLWLKKDYKEVEKTINKWNKNIDKSTKKTSSSFWNLKTAIIWAFSITAILAFWKQLLTFWSDLEEITSKFNVVFAWVEKEAQVAFNAMADAVWRSRLQLIEFWGNLGDVLKPMWFTTEEALKLSTNMTKLAIDVASFNNVSDAQAVNAFRSALTWEREALKTLWIVISEADLKTEAYTSWIAKQGATLTKQQKTLATYNLLLANTADAQGDAVRTAWSFANELKRLQGAWKDLIASAWKDIAEGTAWFLRTTTNFLNESGGNIIDAFKNVGNWIWSILGQAFEWFRLLFQSLNWMFSDSADDALSWGKIIAKVVNAVNIWFRSLGIVAQWFADLWGNFVDLFWTAKNPAEEFWKTLGNLKNRFLDLWWEVITFNKWLENNIATGKDYKVEFDKIWDIADKYKNWLNGATKATWGATKATKELENALKPLNQSFKETTDVIDDEIWKSTKKIKDFTNEIEKANWALKDIQTEIWELETWRAETLWERNIEILEEEKKIREELKELRAWERPSDFLENENRLLAEFNALQTEKRLIQANSTEAELNEAKRINELSPTAKFLEDFEEEKKILEEKKAIKAQELLDLETQKADEELILEWFTNAKIILEEKFKEEKFNLEIEITGQLEQENVKRIDSLKKVQDQALATARALRELSSAQATETTSTTWFASGWFTWSWGKNQVAGVVHRWEYVIPKNMVNSLPDLVWWLEKMRTWGSVSNDNSKNLNVWGVTLNSWIDAQEFFWKMLWQM